MIYKSTLFLLLMIVLGINYSGYLVNGELTSTQKRAYDITISFSGDAMVHSPQILVARTADGGFDFHRSFVNIAPIWKSVDFAVVNFETTLSHNGRYSGYPMFCSPVEFAQALADAGIDVAALANNHICDRGSRGLDHTIEQLNQMGVKTYGAHQSLQTDTILYVEKYPFRVAMLNYTYGTNGMPVPNGKIVHHIDTTLIAQHIDKAKAQNATHIIVFYHWGNEYQLKANTTQQNLALWSRKRGADVVIGSHPHVIQQVDSINSIVYSLGNLISNQQDKHTDIGQTAVISLNKYTKPQIKMITHINNVMGNRRNERYVLEVL